MEPSGCRPPLIAAAVLAGLAIAGAANAATDTLSLTGVVADSVYGTLSSGGINYNTWTLSLNGLDSTNALTVSQGDQVDVTITFDQNVVVNIPASTNFSILNVVFDGAFSSGNNSASGNAKFFDGVSQVSQGGAGTNDPNGLGLGVGFAPPANFTFDSIGLNYQITALGGGGPATLTSAYLEMYVPNGSFGAGGGGGGGPSVPEPAPWSLTLVGFGALGAALRSRRRSAVLAA